MRRLLLISMFLLFIPLVLAESIPDCKTWEIQVTDSSDNALSGTYTFNITLDDDSDESSPFYSNQTSATTTANGWTNITFCNINPPANAKVYTFYRRDGVLKYSEQSTTVFYADNVRYADNSSINSTDDYNFNEVWVALINGVNPLDLNDTTFYYNQTAISNSYTDSEIDNINTTSTWLQLMPPVGNFTLLNIDNITGFSYNYNQSDGSFNQTYVNFNLTSNILSLLSGINNWLTLDNTNITNLNETISNLGVRIGFNSTFNSTYDDFAYNQTGLGDTNASTACSTNQFLDGDGNCVDYSSYITSESDPQLQNNLTNGFDSNIKLNTGWNVTFTETGGNITSNSTCVSIIGPTASLHVC